jgi:hypothetical protein
MNNIKAILTIDVTKPYANLMRKNCKKPLVVVTH